MLFKEIRDSFENKGFAVTPVNKKIPILKEWQKVDAPDGADAPGVGLVCGERSGVIALDIDSDEILEEASKYFHSPFSKVGKKGITYFFKYNGEKNQKWTPYFEVLSTGNQTVLPPSPHSDGVFYVWKGLPITSDLLELPDLPKNYVSIIESLVTKRPNKSGDNEGRNNALKEQASAAFFSGKNVEEVALELMDYDDKNHTPPLFSDPSEPNMKDDPEMNAFNFAYRIKKSMIQNKAISALVPTPTLEIVDYELDDIKEDYKEYKYPQFRGVAQEIFKNCYENSIIPRTRFSVAATLAVMGTVLGNKISLKRNYTNFYIMIMGESTGGKGFPTNYANRFFHSHKDLNGLSGVAAGSTAGFVDGMKDYCTRLDVMDEARTFFDMATDKNSFNSGLALLMSSAYTSPGGIYNIPRTQKRVDSVIKSPCISFIGGMNVKDFQRGASWAMVQQGIIGRMLFFVDTEFKDKNKDISDEFFIPQEILDWAASLRRLKKYAPESDVLAHHPDCNNLAVDKKFTDHIYELDKKWHQKASEDQELAPAINRFSELIYKMIMIDHSSVLWKIPAHKMVQMPIQSQSVEWAIEWIEAYLKNTELFLGKNLAKSKFRIEMADIEKLISSKRSGLSKSDIINSAIVQRHNLYGRNLDMVLQTLVDSDTIIESKIPSGGRKKTIFVHKKHVKVKE